MEDTVLLNESVMASTDGWSIHQHVKNGICSLVPASNKNTNFLRSRWSGWLNSEEAVVDVVGLLMVQRYLVDISDAKAVISPSQKLAGITDTGKRRVQEDLDKLEALLDANQRILACHRRTMDQVLRRGGIQPRH
jgi:hypothetical protein